MAKLAELPGKTLLILVRVYRYALSPMLGQHCRFHPSCSAYAEQALRQHGAIKGLSLSLWRLLRCNPFSRGGYDPVPGDLFESKEPVTGASCPPIETIIDPNFINPKGSRL
ncbi:MAG TPA: membrane protein insertion efficiency factor YidD [Gammaproteobacteria bacterium]|nr:membrane protein insertion efficiency factor YidD [Gammaproteobacteria bacterium]